MGQQSGGKIKLDIYPGMYTDETPVGAMGRWVDCNLVRWKNGMAQTVGGWKSQVLDTTLLGVPRSTHDWVALDGTKYIAVGTEKRLYLIVEALTVTNITPVRDSGGLTNPFSTDNGGAFDPSGSDASFVSVADATHGCTVGDIVTFDSFSAIGGITLVGDYEVIKVTDATNYIIKHSSAASSTVSGGGGSGNFVYEITVGSGATGIASGWGTGLWGKETWGTARAQSTFVQELRTWSLDNWGEDLIASPRGGEIYAWDKSVGLGTPAAEITQAPNTNLRVLVSPENRQLIALGAHNGSTDDPLFVAWSDNEDYTTWIPANSNNAGDKRIDQGSEIVTGIVTRNGIVIFTDISVHIMQAVGGSDVFAFDTVGTGISIAGPLAAADANGVVYFMGKTNFYRFDGILRVLKCSVWTRLFDVDDENNNDLLNVEQAFSVKASHNKNFNEVWWFYPSKGQSTNGKYVVYNYEEDLWFFGTLDRASFNDFSTFFNKPFAFDNDGLLYTHEDGVDDDASEMLPFIESGDMEIADGDELMHVSKLIPDFQRLSGSVTVTLKGRKYPQGDQYTKGPYTATFATTEMGVRIRARQMAIRIEQAGLGAHFRMGTWRSRIVPDGER